MNPLKTPSASRSKVAYEKVLAKFLSNPLYAKGYMHRFDDDEDEFSLVSHLQVCKLTEKPNKFTI